MVRTRTAVAVFARDFEMDLFVSGMFADIENSAELLGIGQSICVFLFVKACTFGVRKIMHRAYFVARRLIRLRIIFTVAFTVAIAESKQTIIKTAEGCIGICSTNAIIVIKIVVVKTATRGFAKTEIKIATAGKGK